MRKLDYHKDPHIKNISQKYVRGGGYRLVSRGLSQPIK